MHKRMEIRIFDNLVVEENVLKWTFKKHYGTVWIGFIRFSNVMKNVWSLVTNAVNLWGT
jgi:hypothetical protein